MLVIIQPETLERVLSGICYKASWLFSSAHLRGRDVRLYEDAGLYDCDDIFARHGKSARYVVDLSSYPQLDLVRQIAREFRDYDISYIGLDGLLMEHGLLPLFDPEQLGLSYLEGAFEYHRITEKLRPRLCSDYDAHLVEVDDGRPWMPAFFSVGCDRKCGYCYVGYTSFPYGFIPVDQAKQIIDHYAALNCNVHFFDEDFFAHPQVDQILEYMRGKGVRWICLTTSVSLSNAIRRHGQDYLVEAGNAMNEVGVETADAAVLDKRQDLQTLHDSPRIIPFWLTVTFFPRETIASKYSTGRFLEQWGYNYDEAVPRMRCNSTHGGLGQFFVPYHGTPWFKKIGDTGRMLERSPTRLWPGYVPFTFLNSVPEPTGPRDHDERWFALYGVGDIWKDVLAECDGTRTVEDICGVDQRRLVTMAQLAQLGAVK